MPTGFDLTGLSLKNCFFFFLIFNQKWWIKVKYKKIKNPNSVSSPAHQDEWDKSVCTCLSSACQHAFSCHGETVATWAPSSWERHRGGSDLGTHQQKVRSFTERWLLAAGSGSALDPDGSSLPQAETVEYCTPTAALWHFMAHSSLPLF